MVVQYIREQAWWRLDSPGPSPVRVARSVVALLDAAACIAEIPENPSDPPHSNPIQSLLNGAGSRFC